MTARGRVTAGFARDDYRVNWLTPVLPVREPPLDVKVLFGEPGPLVEAERCGVVAVDVQQRRWAAPSGQMPEAPDEQGVAEPQALRSGRDAEYVHFAEPVGMHLGPVVAEHIPGPFGQQEAGRVEPRLGDARLQIAGSPPALLGVRCECGGVDRQPRVVVLSRLEGAHDYVLRQRRVLGQIAERPT